MDMTTIASLEGLDIYGDSMDPKTILLSRIFNYLTKNEMYNVPITCVQIDWDVIAFDGLKKPECIALWRKVLNKARFYRSAGEVLFSALQEPDQMTDPNIQTWNHKFLSMAGSSDLQSTPQEEETTDPKVLKRMQKDKLRAKKEEMKAMKEELEKYPKKPITAYLIYSTEKMKSKGFTMAQAAHAWKEEDSETLLKYKQKAKEQADEYLWQLEAFIKENPDDVHAKNLYLKAQKLSEAKMKLGSKRNHLGSEDSTDLNNSTVLSAPSPKKKRKRKESGKEWTGFLVYYDKKKEEMSVENPGMSEDKITAKLERRYNKMSDSKKEKYVTMANSLNEEKS